MAKQTVIQPIGINSSTGQHHSALNAADGGLWIDNRIDAWIQYDLGSVQKVSGVNIGFDNPTQITYNFTLDVSKDGLGYVEVIDDKTSSKKAGVQKFAIRPKDARFVRLCIHDNNNPADPHKAAIDIFEVIAGVGGKKKTTTKKVVKKTTVKRRYR